MAQGDHDRAKERNQLREEWLRQGRTREQIAVAMCRKFHDRKRAAWRNAYGWNQQHVADLFNKKLNDPDNPITGSRISDYERWPISSQTKPTIPTLGILADIYDTTILNLVDEHDYPKMNRKERAYLAALKKQLSATGNNRSGGLPFPDAGSMTPQQLPNVSPYFVGRTEELDKLTAQLDTMAKDGPIVITAIGGTAGIGKTALAVQWAQTHSDEFPDGQLYVNLRGFHPTGIPLTPQEAIRGFLDVFHVPVEKIPVSLDAQAHLYRKLVKDKWLVMVLDNARDTDQVRPLLPGSPTCMVLVTSRQQLESLVYEDITHIILGFLSTEEAHQLLTDILKPERIEAEPDTIDELIHRCVHLPIALHIAAARIKAEPHTSLSVLLGQLRAQPQSLTALSTGDSLYFDIRAVFSWSYTALSTRAARLFRLLGLHSGPDISTLAAASLAGLPEDDTRNLLTELIRAHLLEESTPGRYQFHDLLGAYANEKARIEEPEPQQLEARHRILDHYLHTAHAAARILDSTRAPTSLDTAAPGVIPETMGDYHEALTWFGAEHRVLIAAISQADNEGLYVHAWKLPYLMATFLSRQGHWHDLLAIQRIALTAAGHLADRAAQAFAHRSLGRAAGRLGDDKQAQFHYQQALNLFSKVGDLASQAHTYLNRGTVLERQSRYRDALDDAEHALRLFEASEQPVGQANALNALGWYLGRLGDYHEALKHCERALVLHRELNDSYGEAATLDSLGYVHHKLGHYTRAVAYYEQAFSIRHELGDRYNEANTLARLGDTHNATGNITAARQAWQQALTIFEQLNHLDADQVRTKLAALDDIGPDEPPAR